MSTAIYARKLNVLENNLKWLKNILAAKTMPVSTNTTQVVTTAIEANTRKPFLNASRSLLLKVKSNGISKSANGLRARKLRLEEIRIFQAKIADQNVPAQKKLVVTTKKVSEPSRDYLM